MPNPFTGPGILDMAIAGRSFPGPLAHWFRVDPGDLCVLGEMPNVGSGLAWRFPGVNSIPPAL